MRNTLLIILAALLIASAQQATQPAGAGKKGVAAKQAAPSIRNWRALPSPMRLKPLTV